ncbi:BREX-2 system adenine-specific DNA-methyltransferase PglX [Actinomadura sp. SCN-SB]|uniref:BREX-2 system adenine-specific DNA-methyltransferase PglX n=1 Tax=Actinomadura sp. SCN-SB TaxID=3373092 RepID=UPI003753A3AF
MTVDQAALLKDLRRQVTALEDDLRERTEAEPGYGEALRAEDDRARQARRTAATFGAWRDERVTQAAVAWVLATVFVRFCEDNRLIPDPWIAGPGERLIEAEERHQAFFRRYPDRNDRDWLIAAFDHLAGAHETVAGLFDRRHNPLWELEPSYEAASELLRFWRRVGPDGAIIHDFTDAELETRFLGDLYQDLSTHAKKTYALLQTPEFVMEFILDLTLKPALKEFGLEPKWRFRPSGWPGDPDEEVRGLRTIDPACGSGHFLLGIFKRLLAEWEKKAPGLDKWERIRRTLESIHGCDKNPFAADIARFRLLIAALKASGETRLHHAGAFPINVAVGDSLLHGRGVESDTDKLFGDEQTFHYRSEDIDKYSERCDLLGLNSYHVVVANPPYITVKDKQENENYRAYSAASGKYALSVPFAQRIFELAIIAGGKDRDAGFTGQITANSFMKREFGKKLIEEFLPKVDLSHVIDTSGAYIPGHGTPTVILIGRNRMPYRNSKIRAILGVRGEPGVPDDPRRGQVWSAITAQVNEPGSDSEWVTVEDLERPALARHPWSLTGGGAGELKETIEKSATARISDVTDSIGFHDILGEDEVFSASRKTSLWKSRKIPTRPLISGDLVRDWVVGWRRVAWPYTQKGGVNLSLQKSEAFWPYRSLLRSGLTFGKTREERDMAWHEHVMLSRSRTQARFLIAYGEVATHNSFILSRGGKIFKQTAPVIKLPEEAGEDAYLGLLGLLNSSTACFWLKQVSHVKGGSGIGRGIQDELWESRFAFNATRLEQFPLSGVLPVELAARLDQLAATASSLAPASIVEKMVPTRLELDRSRAEEEARRRTMVGLQEELDWKVYGLYGILTDAEVENVTLPSGDVVPEVRLGERAFEIVLARKMQAGEVTTAWFDRHGSAPVTEVPERWPEEYRRVVQARIDLIEKRPKDIGLLERPEYKRRWLDEPWEKKERAALRDWILDRCEREEIWFAMRDGYRQPRTLTIAQLADQFRGDEDMQSVAALYASDHMGKNDVPLETVLAQVINDQHVPYLGALRYTDTGLRKREEWEQVWEQQREEDRTGERLDIPVPPHYKDKDFRAKSYWSQRGKLDVPKERFISYPGASPEMDGTLLIGWAGWDHKDQAQALINIIRDRTEQSAWETEKIRPLLAGLLEVMPWVRQWHGEYDEEWGGNPAEEFGTFFNQECAKHQLAEHELRSWRPEEPRRGRRSKSE